MSFKTTYWLFGILVLIVAVVGIALYLDPMPADLSAWVFPDENTKSPLALDRVNRLRLERADPAEKIVLERDDKLDLWRMKEPVAAEADRVNVDDLVRRTVQLKRNVAIEPGNPAKLGLEPAKAVLTLAVLPDRELKLELGDSTFGTSDAVMYVRSSQRPQVCVVPKNEIDSTLKSANFFRNRAMLASAPSDVLSVKIAHTVDDKAKEAVVELVKDKEKWGYKLPFTGDANNSSTDVTVKAGEPPTNVAALLDQIVKMQVAYKDDKDNDYVANGVTDWKQYGLDSAGDLLTVEIKRAEKPGKDAKPDDSPSSTQTLVVAVGKKVDDKSDKYFARRASEMNVVKLPSAPVAALLDLLAKPESLRERRLLTLDSERRIPNVFSIKNPNNPAADLEFFKREDGWKLYRAGAATPSLVDEGVVKGLLSLIGQDKMIEGFPDTAKMTEAEMGLDKPALVASFWLDGIDDKKPEKKEGEPEAPALDPKAKPKLKTDKPTATLTFGKRDGTKKTVFVKRVEGDGPAGVFEAREVLFDRLGESPLGFLAKRLPGFRDGADNASIKVTKLVLTNKGKTMTLSRDKDSDPWKVDAPASLAGRKIDDGAVTGVLGTLNAMQAMRFVADKPTANQLTNEYGLNPPDSQVAITATNNDKAEVYEILFGKEAGDGGVFAKFAGAYNSDLVFVLDRSLLNLFERDLLDPTIFAFDISKVKEVTFRGWQEINKKVLPLELVRKDARTWEAKKTPFSEPYSVNSEKFNQFLAVLSRLRADGVQRGKEPTADHGLDVKTGALSIWVFVEGVEKPYTLIVGKAEGTGFAASSSTMPGDLLIVSRSLFDDLKKSVGFFEK